MKLPCDDLTFRERNILKLRRGCGDGYIYTLKEVAKIWGITEGRVRTIERKAKEKLKGGCGEVRKTDPR